MKKISGLIILTLLAGCGQATIPSTAAVPTASTAGTVASTDAARRFEVPSFMTSGISENTIVVRYKTGERHRGLNAASLGWAHTELVTVANAEERDRVIAELRQDPNVEFAEPDYHMQAYMTPNDPNYGKQWDMQKIAMPAAWDVNKGDGVKVAVVDTGVDASHEDLKGQVLPGYDFANRDSDPSDDQGHGSHVAGTIAAMTNNGVGVVGIAPNCKILPVKVLSADGGGSTSTIAQGINYAVQQGAKVINMSLGGPSDSQVLRQAVASAIQAGVVVVVAAGNDNTTTKMYPAAYDGVISVGASDQNDQKASFSNYGDWISVVAPGTSILSTSEGSYKTMQGTSMASPHVAGVAALVRSYHPDWSATQVRAAIMNSGDPVKGFESAPNARRLNALKALQYGGGGTTPTPAPSTQPNPEPSAPVTTPTPDPGSPGTTPAPGDGPAISQVGVRPSGNRSAQVRWTTDRPADGQLEIGTTQQLGSQSKVFSKLVTAHTVTVTNLRSRQTYYIRVTSKDAQGRESRSAVMSFRAGN